MAPTLKSSAGKGGNYGPEMPMTISTLQGAHGRGYRIDAEGAAGGHIVPTLRSHPRPGSNSDGAIAFDWQSGGDVRLNIADRTSALTKEQTPATHTEGSGVRRLTPRECERLQGFPDDWTLVPGVKCPDSRRYAAMGNAVTVNVAEWIGRRIIAIEESIPETFLEAAHLAVCG